VSTLPPLARGTMLELLGPVKQAERARAGAGFFLDGLQPGVMAYFLRTGFG
jgi:hypothetical protein